MNWLYTFNDGCNGQRVGGTLDHDGAVALLQKRDELTKEEANEALTDGARNCQEVQCCDGEAALLPIVEDEYVPNEDED